MKEVEEFHVTRLNEKLELELILPPSSDQINYSVVGVSSKVIDSVYQRQVHDQASLLPLSRVHNILE